MKNWKKRMLALLVCALFSLFCVVLAACGEEEADPDDGGGTDTTVPDDDDSDNDGGTDTTDPDDGDDDSDDEVALKTFAGLTLEDATYTYDGEEHSLEVSGDIPDGTSVVYTGNGQTNAGTYNVTAELTNEEYTSMTLSGVLTIEKASYPTSVYMNDDSVLYDGNPHSLEVAGDIPEGTTITYTNNAQTDAGEYEVTATLVNDNYVDTTLTATLIIYTVGEVVDDVVASAEEILANLFSAPDPWGFLPEAMSEESMAYETTPVNGEEGFADFVSVDSIGTKMIGEQLDVLYDGLCNAETAIRYASVVFNAATSITELYQKYINDNPQDYNLYEGSITIGGYEFTLTIEVDGSDVTLTAGNDTVSVQIATDSSEDAEYTNIGRIQITSGIVLKYALGDNRMTLGISCTVAGVGVIQEMDFEQDDDGNVSGSLYAYYGTESANIDVAALLYSDSDYTVIISDNRETSDLAIDAYVEVYDSQTGEMLGGEVAETVSLADYDTYWFNLYDVSGLETVKVLEAESTGLNANDIYVNGSDSVFEVKSVGGLSLKTLSRRFDIEMKTVSYIVGTDGEYEKVSVEIPMLFVQAEYTDSFKEDVTEENSSLSLSLDSDLLSVVGGKFTAYKDVYMNGEDSISYSDITSFISSL